jgi:hypothetical protein
MFNKVWKWYLGLVGIDSDAGDKGGADKGAGDKGGEPKLSQSDVDRIVQERLARERSKFADYEELRKFRDEHAKQADEAQKAELAKQKKYEEAEALYKKQLGEREQLLSAKDQQIQDMQISSTLAQEISKQNGFVEESIALLRQNAVLTKDGVVVLKVRDANGIEKEVAVEEGLKQFYSARPHLLRAKSTTSGSGSTASGSNAGAGSDDLGSLNTQLIQAMTRGDRKTAEDIKKKIQAHPQVGNRNAF